MLFLSVYTFFAKIDPKGKKNIFLLKFYFKRKQKSIIYFSLGLIHHQQRAVPETLLVQRVLLSDALRCPLVDAKELVRHFLYYPLFRSCRQRLSDDLRSLVAALFESQCFWDLFIEIFGRKLCFLRI